MTEIINGEGNNEEEEALEAFDEATDEELKQAGDDPVKLKEIIKVRTQSRQKLFNRAKTAEGKLKQAKPEVKPAPKKEGEGLDRVDKAILRTEKIVEEDEVELVEKIMKETGKTVEETLDSKYFQSELKTLREDKETANAIPGNSKRSGQSNSSTVEYWISKGQLPPVDQPKLRQAVVNRKIELEKSGNTFSKNPIQ
jgi:acyl-CoA reductase-like NAD-dependent aldehyde dehydrogenase